MSLTAFVVASLAFLLTPGPTNTLLAAAGAGGGIRGGVMLPAAEGIGYAVAIGAFLGATRYLSDVGFALPVLKAMSRSGFCGRRRCCGANLSASMRRKG